MKTFKMLSFDMKTAEGIHKFPLTDGIVINQENSHQLWLLELFIPSTYREVFEQLSQTNQLFDARAVISSPENEPAPFKVIVSAITEIGDHISVLLQGRIKAKRNKYAEQLLQQLLEEDLHKDELFQRFKQGMKERPALKEQ